jgi:hypothetical protein
LTSPVHDAAIESNPAFSIPFGKHDSDLEVEYRIDSPVSQTSGINTPALFHVDGSPFGRTTANKDASLHESPLVGPVMSQGVVSMDGSEEVDGQVEEPDFFAEMDAWLAENVDVV